MGSDKDESEIRRYSSNGPDSDINRALVGVLLGIVIGFLVGQTVVLWIENNRLHAQVHLLQNHIMKIQPVR